MLVGKCFLFGFRLWRPKPLASQLADNYTIWRRQVAGRSFVTFHETASFSRRRGRRPAVVSNRRLRTERDGPIHVCVARQKPVRLIVRRGASRRFEALARKTADLPVVVTWDRRSEDRRASPGSVSVERRSSDRRKAPPFTWDAADFVVVDDASQPDATAPPPIPRSEGDATSKAGDRRHNLATTPKVKRRKARDR
jgi:hypothetical protein